MISKETIELIEKKSNSKILDLFYTIKIYPQLAFSLMFSQTNIPLDDFTDEFGSLFWNSVDKTLKNFTNKEKYIIVPIQYIFR